ncbi:[FeFe] hydrogenase H-cluster radical SAM maturase HydE [candidate division KSB1 bacterium]|nr:[FeFe] hydrogenase H-cluster radical SAM maturase HydE [candidate division KSB1 bacterium]
MDKIFSKIDNRGKLDRSDLVELLQSNLPGQMEKLCRKAYDVKSAEVGKRVYFRGIIEFSNICSRDCYYCGIRKSNFHSKRFNMSDEEILTAATWAWENHYGSIVLQSGERNDSPFVDRITALCRKIKDLSHGELGITLSLGEQSPKTYRRWFDAGAHRYLLRIETSNSHLYKNIHPAESGMEQRIACLNHLRDAGYQVGTGVMIGLPGQSAGDLADDILFYEKQDIDMIGMGPYIVHNQTPMAQTAGEIDAGEQLNKALKMIAVTRLYLRNVNIAATTALQALDPLGREKGLLAGANIIMPNITDTKYRAAYQLYENKPCLDENSGICRSCLEKRIKKIDESIGYNQWGDSPHFYQRKLELPDQDDLLSRGDRTGLNKSKIDA